MAHVRQGQRASVVFVGARGDLELVEAAADVDPTFAALLEEADEVGVALLAARVSLDSTGARDPVAIPVRV
jgi:sugar fermentation stimulation protein A